MSRDEQEGMRSKVAALAATMSQIAPELKKYPELATGVDGNRTAISRYDPTPIQHGHVNHHGQKKKLSLNG